MNSPPEKKEPAERAISAGGDVNRHRVRGTKNVAILRHLASPRKLFYLPLSFLTP
jgi:hypothetical protein